MNAPHKPLVVIAATSQSDKEQTAKEVTEIARKWRDRKEQAPVVFTWMDADRWGSWLKSMYGVKPSHLPQPLVTNHSVRGGCLFLDLYSRLLAYQRLVYYDVDPFGEPVKLTPASLFPTINGAARGTLSYKHSENIVERLARV